MAELVRLGAYRVGTDAGVDEALRLAPRIEALISQGKGAPTPLDDAFAALAEALADAP
jgi:flagellum-specific ATP synthase